MITKIIIFSLVMPLAIGGIIGIASAQSNQGSLPGAGITPESPFFFLDRIGEGIRRIFTFGTEAKIELEIEHAAERIAEIKVMLDDKGVDAPGIEVARQRLEVHLRRADSILENERSRGRDVSVLAQNVISQIRERREALRQVFEARKEAFKSQEDDLNRRIDEARQAGNDALVRDLQAQREAIKVQREGLEAERRVQENILEAQRERVEDRLSTPLQAQERINKADFERQRLIDKATLRSFAIPQAELASLDAMLNQAKQAFSQNNFAEAERLARQADLGYEVIRERIDSPDDNGVSGREVELRGREAEGETEIRGRENEAEVRGQEVEIRGGVNEAGDDRGGNSGSGRSGGSGGGSLDD